MQYSCAHFRINVEKKDFTDFQTELFLHFLIKFPHNTFEIHSYSCLILNWSFQLYPSTWITMMPAVAAAAAAGKRQDSVK